MAVPDRATAVVTADALDMDAVRLHPEVLE